MKLLIVDDEELTRTGVISSIDWQSIGIQAVSYTHLHASEGLPPPAAGGPAHGLSYGTCFHKSHLW